MTTLILLLLLGFILLIKGAGLLVDGSVFTAQKFRVSPLIIGLTIVSFGTSAPELAVNILAALDPNSSSLGLGNIIGSNIANIGLILGATAAIAAISVKKVLTAREIPFLFLSSLVFLILVSDKVIGHSDSNLLSRGDGWILLILFVIFIYYLINAVIAQRKDGLTEEFSEEYKKKSGSLTLALGMIALGLGGVAFGGKLVVDNATQIAASLGLSEILIGLTVVAIGTSLPELVTSVVAAFKKEPDIAVGNIVGSNIFNTFLVLGVSSTITPIMFEKVWFVDIAVMILLSALLFWFSKTKSKISRIEGVTLLIIFATYITFTIIRG